jgi:TolA-binding protein
MAFLLPALVLHLSAEEAKPASKTAPDEDMEALARKAMSAQDPAFQKEALQTLRKHRFRSTRAPQREYALFVQGILEDRHEGVPKAAETLRKLERAWPNSPYLSEAQIILGQDAAERRRFKDAETRLRKVLFADVPVEGKRRAQELLLWVFVEQSQPEKGLPILETLYPLGTAKPTEKGLAAMTEILAAAKREDQAEAARKDYHSLYPNGAFGPRVEFAIGRMLGTLGKNVESAQVFQKLITESGNSPEADEARLALAALISEGKIEPKDATAFPNPQQLLSEIRRAEKKGDLARRAMLVKLRMHVNASQWKEAVDLAAKIRAKEPTEAEVSVITALRGDAFRAWAQELLDKRQIEPLLAYLDPEGIQSLASEQRSLLAQYLAQVGLPAAALTLVELAPRAEQPALKRTILDGIQADAHPAEVLKTLPGSKESGIDALKRAQAAMALKDWKTVPAALNRAKPGPERIALLTAYLRRPGEPSEAGSLLKAAEGWLAKAPEKGADREPLVLLVADLRARFGDWRGALNLYPTQATKEQQGWVALMRATCQWKLGQPEAAKATLKQAENESGFRMERTSLAKQLGM